MTEREALAVAVAYKAEQFAKALVRKVAIAITIITLGCASALYLINQRGVARADKNSCVVHRFLDSAAQARRNSGTPDDLQTAKQYSELANLLQPPSKACVDLLGTRSTKGH